MAHFLRDVLSAREYGDYKEALEFHDWDTVRSLERLARKRIGGGIPADDAIIQPPRGLGL